MLCKRTKETFYLGTSHNPLEVSRNRMRLVGQFPMANAKSAWDTVST